MPCRKKIPTNEYQPELSEADKIWTIKELNKEIKIFERVKEAYEFETQMVKPEEEMENDKVILESVSELLEEKKKLLKKLI